MGLGTGEFIGMLLSVAFGLGAGCFAFFRWMAGGLKESIADVTKQIDALVSDKELDEVKRKMDERFKGAGHRFGDLEKSAHKLERELLEFKSKVAESYVTKADLTILQQRLENMIDALTKHVDTKFDDLRKSISELAVKGTCQ